jgi:glutamate formiminotransferase/glutamate formiminotransferase/formiminotetrahydrofolate cyclodeaminase
MDVTDRPQLLAVPNASEGRDDAVIGAIGEAFRPARLLDVHSDPDHGRSVFTLAARQGELASALLAGAREAVARIDLRRHDGSHPHVGALDVVPVVYLDESQRGPACAEALTAAALIGDELELPVFLYGELATREEHRERAALRAGGPDGLAARLELGDTRPDYGPSRPHPTAGAVLVAARPPLVAFNVDLVTDDLERARAIATGLRESGGGPPGVRAIGLFLPERGRAQVSVNVHDHRAAPLREVVERVRAQAEIAEAELVGLTPRAALDGFPDDVPLRGFDPERHLIENALRSG